MAAVTLPPDEEEEEHVPMLECLWAWVRQFVASPYTWGGSSLVGTGAVAARFPMLAFTMYSVAFWSTVEFVRDMGSYALGAIAAVSSGVGVTMVTSLNGFVYSLSFVLLVTGAAILAVLGWRHRDCFKEGNPVVKKKRVRSRTSFCSSAYSSSRPGGCSTSSTSPSTYQRLWGGLSSLGCFRCRS